MITLDGQALEATEEAGLFRFTVDSEGRYWLLDLYHIPRAVPMYHRGRNSVVYILELQFSLSSITPDLYLVSLRVSEVTP